MSNSGIVSTTGQVLGASTAVAAGIAILPDTGGSIIPKILSLLSITLGSLCLASFAITRILKKVW